MNKIMIIPLDERPCNYNYIPFLTKDTPYTLLLPPLNILGDKKQKADLDSLHLWIKQNIANVTHLIISIDMLIYGGIVPSRLHQDDESTLLNRLNLVNELKTINPKLTIYAFNLIMRNPTYSSNDEEPDYYQDFGREIHLKGVYTDKQELGIITNDEQQALNNINTVLPNEFYEDYTNRRKRNLTVNKHVLQLLKKDIIDYLVIPQDDASVYGLTAIDQRELQTVINNLSLTNVLMYPDADAVLNTLFIRAVNKLNNTTPKTYIEYAVEDAQNTVPKFEDRPLNKSIPLQIEAAGGVVTTNKDEADIILMVNATTTMVDINAPKDQKESPEYTQVRNMSNFIANIKQNLQTKPVIIADVAYSNGSDEVLIKKLINQGIYFKLAGYAAWNTSGNTLGTCIPQGYLYLQHKDTKSHINFLGLRYVEDYLYMTKVRKDVSNNVLKDLNYNYFFVEKERGKVSKIVHGKLSQLIESNNLKNKLIIKDCYMPWRRMFEVGLEVEVNLCGQ